MDTNPADQPSLLIKLLVLKKMLFGGLMLTISTLSLLGWNYHDEITAFANVYLLNAEYGLVGWVIEHLAQTPPQKLSKIAALTGVYGLLIETAAVGLWLGLGWAEPLFIGLVAALIPLEGYEVLYHPSTSKVVLFTINLVIVVILSHHWLTGRLSKTQTYLAE
ncbi:MAG TPA: DUF2127 domain-containing protein [Leptolyngbyaceae cyanobacterium M65_K2018_010]|nr:DUF2127 domain-containing protein [Leptolyngbyaceae cyanobacterium M65_K2018_010]